MGIIDKGAVGAHLLQHVPQRAHDAAVDKGLGIIDQNGGIGHGIQHSANVVEHRFLAVAEAHQRVLVLVALASEHQLAVLSQHLILWKDFLPLLDGDIEFGFRKFHLLAHELVGLKVHQFAHLVVEHDIEQLVKLGLRQVLQLRIGGIHAVEQVLDRAGQRFHVGRRREQRLQRRNAVCLVTQFIDKCRAEAALAGAIGTNDGNLF